MNPDLKSKILAKRKAWNKFYKDKSPVNQELWHKARNISNNYNDRSCILYEDRIISERKSNPKALWAYVKKRTKKSGDITAWNARNEDGELYDE